MKRIFSTAFSAAIFGLAAAALAGCPIYSDDSSSRAYPAGGCYSDYDCGSGYYCTGDGYCAAGGPTGTTGCRTPSDCSSGDNCGSDGQCHVGDCTNSGCPAGYQCKLSGGVVACVPNAGGGSDGGIVGNGDGGSTTDGGKTDGGTSGCQQDSDCSSLGAGAKCLNGTCIAAPNQCWDGTQCASGEKCVSGVCTPACGPSAPCPTGYSCDAKGVCTGNPTPCGSGGGTCASGTTCVEQHCVPPCGDGGSCPTGEVCVQGGCIPDQTPHFVCGADGTPGNGGPGNCAVGSLCLHHNCYIACTQTDAGLTCQNADQFNVCTAVSIAGSSSGSYNVCGSGSNLGSQCDATHACTSAGTVCIDGYCK